jgi:hypothetical protein
MPLITWPKAAKPRLSPGLRLGVEVGQVAGADEEVALARARRETAQRDRPRPVSQARLGGALVRDPRERLRLGRRPGDDGAFLRRAPHLGGAVEGAAVVLRRRHVAQEVGAGDRRLLGLELHRDDAVAGGDHHPRLAPRRPTSGWGRLSAGPRQASIPRRPIAPWSIGRRAPLLLPPGVAHRPPDGRPRSVVRRPVARRGGTSRASVRFCVRDDDRHGRTHAPPHPSPPPLSRSR